MHILLFFKDGLVDVVDVPFHGMVGKMIDVELNETS